MTVTTFGVVTAGGTLEADVQVLGGVQPSRELDLQVWTAVTASPASERLRGVPTLIVLPGLRRALSVRLYETADDVAVEDPETGVFGSGDDLPAAVQDFENALRDHLAVLAEDDALAPNLQHQLEILRGYFSMP